MEKILFILSALSCLAGVVLALDLFIGNLGMHALRNKPQPPDESSGEFFFPKVSMIIPARNEAKTIEAALRTMVTMNYPDLEILAVNDRSEDATGEILESLKQEFPQLRVVHIQELPPDWLGKNNALHQGALQAMGSILLFTDADIHYDPLVLRRAVYTLENEKLDHLALFPQIVVEGFWLKILICAFAVFFQMFSRPWKARDPKSSSHIGIGAFNMIRKSVYEKIGGFVPISLRPDDDIKLGKLVKINGYRQDGLLATEYLSVHWYASVKEMINGLMKNAFSGLDYRLSIAVGGLCFQFLVFIFPWLAVWFCDGWTQVFLLINMVLLTFTCLNICKSEGFDAMYALGYPIGTAILSYIIFKATFLTYKNNGIYWRDTFYPLAILKKNRF